MRIVVFIADGAEHSDAVEALARTAEVTVVARACAGVRTPGTVVLTTSPRIARLSAALQRSSPGRVLRRIGPLDPGSVFLRDVRRSSDAIAAVTAADVLVATDRDSVFAVWRLARSSRGNRAARAVAGFAAARQIVQSEEPGRSANSAAGTP